MGSDERTLAAVIKSLKSLGIPDEELEKSLNTAGLLAKKKEIMVNGKPVFKVYWVNPKNEEKEKEKAERENAKQNQKNAPKEKKQELEDYEKPEKEKELKHDDDELPEDVKENIGHAHTPPSGKKPVGVILHDKGSKDSVKKELDKHGIKPAHIDPEKLKHHTDKAVDHATDNKKHITYDASKSDSDHHQKVVKKLKDRGYDVHEIGKK